MFAIDEAYVDAAAPNAEASKNGRGLVLKNKYLQFNISDDETILFGECQGSGKDAYCCSCDFARPEQPTHRCSCPSRQFPCKHCLGLMHAYAQGKKFAQTSLKTLDKIIKEHTGTPWEVLAKREKLTNLGLEWQPTR